MNPSEAGVRKPQGPEGHTKRLNNARFAYLEPSTIVYYHGNGNNTHRSTVSHGYILRTDPTPNGKAKADPRGRSKGSEGKPSLSLSHSRWIADS